MKYDEFAFFNEQLANMLRDGIPLEGALKQLCHDVRQGRLAGELQAVAADLARGTPLDQALQGKKLPDLYIHMVQVGAAANNLPGILRLLADYYRSAGTAWTRLKGLLFYPMIVLVATLALSIVMAFVLQPQVGALAHGFREMRYAGSDRTGEEVMVLVLPSALAVLILGLAVAVSLGPVRRWVRWRISPFREASVSQLASGLAMMLRGGCSLEQALALMQRVERGSPAARDLGRLSACLADGYGGRFDELTQGCRVFPRLFTWIVGNSGEDLAGGLEHAADLFRTRAAHRTDMLLYAALPCSILVLGSLIVFQISFALSPMIHMMQSIGQGY
jgi:type II secretory pathway component PulF